MAEIIWKQVGPLLVTSQVAGRMLELTRVPWSWQRLFARQQYTLKAGNDLWELTFESWGLITVLMPERFDRLRGQISADSAVRGFIRLGDKERYLWSVRDWDRQIEIQSTSGLLLTSKSPWKESDLDAGIVCRVVIEDLAHGEPWLDLLLASVVFIATQEFIPSGD